MTTSPMLNSPFPKLPSGFTGAGCYDEQHAPLIFCHSLNCPINCFDLIIARLFAGKIFVVGLNNQFFRVIIDTTVCFIAFPQLIRLWKRFERKLRLDIFACGRNLVM